MIKSLTLCIKGAPRRVDVGQYTLIVGRNGVGKSAVSIAAELCLSDAATLNGKVVKASGRLIELGKDGTAFAVAELDDGTESSWGLTRQPDGSVKHLFEPAARVVPSEVLPLRGVREVLAGNPETVRATMLGWMVGSVTREDILAAVPAEHQERVKPVLGTKARPAEALLDAVVSTTERVKVAKAQAEAAEAEADRLAGSEPIEESAVQEARSNADAWSAVLSKAIAYETAQALIASAAPAAGDASALQARVAEAEAALAAVPDVGRAEAAVRLLEGHGDACPACSSATGGQHLDACYAWFRGMLQDIPERRRAAEAALHGARHALALASARPAAVTMPENPGVSTDDARASSQAWERVWAERAAKRSAWASVTARREQAKKLRLEMDEVQELLELLVKAREHVLKRGVDAFTAEVQRFMPLRWHIAFRAEHDFRPSLDTGEGVFTELSATQRDAVEVAIAMAIASRGVAAPKRGRPSKQVAADQKFYLAIPDDRDRDPETLGELMRAWSEFRGQVFVEATKKPHGRWPAGWTLLNLDEVAASADGEKTDNEKSAGEKLPAPSEPPAPPADAPALLLPPPPPAS